MSDLINKAKSNRLAGSRILLPRAPSNLGAIAQAEHADAAIARPGASSNPTITRPVPSTIVPNSVVRVTKTAGSMGLQLVDVARWYTGDPGTARVVRITSSGKWLVGPRTAGVADPTLQWGVMLYVEWGSQSMAVQSGWFCVPCDFDLCATYVSVKAAVCVLPYRDSPNPPGPGPDAIGDGIAQVSVSISEGQSDSPPNQLLAFDQGNAVLGANPIYLFGAIVRDAIFTNTNATDVWVALGDSDSAATIGPVVEGWAIKVPPGGQVAQAWDDRAFFNAIWLAVYNSVRAGNAFLDPVNAPSVFVEVRGWAPGVFQSR